MFIRDQLASIHKFLYIPPLVPCYFISNVFIKALRVTLCSVIAVGVLVVWCGQTKAWCLTEGSAHTQPRRSIGKKVKTETRVTLETLCVASGTSSTARSVHNLRPPAL